jgi:hypothetical protein
MSMRPLTLRFRAVGLNVGTINTRIVVDFTSGLVVLIVLCNDLQGRVRPRLSRKLTRLLVAIVATSLGLSAVVGAIAGIETQASFTPFAAATMRLCASHQARLSMGA